MREYKYKGYSISFQEDTKEWLGLGNEEAIRSKRKKDIIMAIDNNDDAKIISREWI